MNILVIGANSFVGQSLIKNLKKKNKIIITSKNSGSKNFFNLNNPNHINLDLNKIDLILYLSYLKKEKKENFENQILSIKKLIKIKKARTKILFFSTICPSLKEKFSYSYTKYIIEKIILKSNGNIVRMGFIYDNKKKLKNNLIKKIANIFSFFSIIPTTSPEYKVYITNLKLFTETIARIINKKELKKKIYIIIDKKKVNLSNLLKILLNKKNNNFNLIKFSRIFINYVFKIVIKPFSIIIYNKYMNLIESENFKLKKTKYKVIFLREN